MEGTAGEQIRVSSDNQNHHDELIDPGRIGDNIHIIGRLIWAGGTLRSR